MMREEKYRENNIEELKDVCCDDNCEVNEENYDIVEETIKAMSDLVEAYALLLDELAKLGILNCAAKTGPDDDWDDDDWDEDDWDEDSCSAVDACGAGSEMSELTDDSNSMNKEMETTTSWKYVAKTGPDDDWDDDDWDDDDDDDDWDSGKTKIDRGEFTFYDKGNDMYDYDGEFLDY